MSLTLAESAKYSTTKLDKAVVDYLVQDDPILQRLKFTKILGNSLTYDVKATRSGAEFYSVNENWNEDTMTLSQNTVSLSILGGMADVDEFIRRTRSDQINIMSENIADKVLAVKETFLDTFYYGDTSSNAKAFDGLHKLITSTTYNTVNQGSGATPAALSIMSLREVVDMIRGFKANAMVMSKKMRRLLSEYLDSVGVAFPATRDDFGVPCRMFDEVPVYVSDHITDTETISSGAYNAKTGGNATSIFVLSFDPKGMQGVQGSNGIETKKLGELEIKDAQRVRIKWYCGLMFQNLRSCAKIDGIDTTADVTS